jgi:hypothetical protein
MPLKAMDYNFDEFNSEGLHRSSQYKPGTWELSQQLLNDRKSNKTSFQMARRRTFPMHTDF